VVEKWGLEAWRHFLKAHAAAVGAIERDLERSGDVPLEWYDVLIAISDAPGGRLRLKDLGRELVLTRSGATRLADKLEAAGLVERQPAHDDRRGITLRLTDGGRKALRRAWPVYARGIREQFLAKLSPDEVATVRTAMARVAAVDDRK
jgi:DNA-binding MarR family transcriptional regulator